MRRRREAGREGKSYQFTITGDTQINTKVTTVILQ
jgi:hypothetical protein